MVLDRKPFPKFKELYLKTLAKYCIHRFKFLILSKKYTGDVRQESLRPGEVFLQHDFAEALKIVHNQEVSVLVSILLISLLLILIQSDSLPLLLFALLFQVQSQHFGGSTSVSIEGYSVHYRQLMDYDLALDFHSFLSDSKVQHASTVYNHMDKLLAKLKKLGVLKDGGRVLCMTDGCAAQYRSATQAYSGWP